MKRLLARYLALPWDKRVLGTAGALAMIPLLWGWMRPEPKLPAAPIVDARFDTHIPHGFVLVPIEVRNAESLDSVLGRFGTVDLYQGEAAAGAKQRLVARNVRLLRAPQNPSHFAVLIPESETARVLALPEPFTVTVKHPDQGGTEVVEDAPVNVVRKRSITYGGG